MPKSKIDSDSIGIDSIEEEVDKIFYTENGFVPDGLYPTMAEKMKKLLQTKIREAKEEAYQEFFEAIDREFGSFKIDAEMGQILQKLKHSLTRPEREEKYEKNK